MTGYRSIVATSLLSIGLLFAAPAGAFDPADSTNASQITVSTQHEDPGRCRTIIGCAEAGPKPENPGDRGGYAQLLTLAFLAGGVGFIMTKVIRAARASQPDSTG
jgi:hypothetical protein